MGRKRKQDKHLPARVYFKDKYYYYVDQNQKWHNLGENLPEAMLKWSKLVDSREKIYTMDQLFDRYMREVAPTKAPSTFKGNMREVENLKLAFGHMPPDAIEPPHIYEYLDIRGKTAKVRANREKALLSHVFSMAIKWGVVRDNPCRHVKRITERKRNRYVTDQEFLAVRAVANDTFRLIMDFAYITGLRKGDVLSVKLSDFTEEGIAIRINKTQQDIILEWSPELKACVDEAKALKKNSVSDFLFTKTSGQPYAVSGFDTLWQRLIKNAIEQGVIKERFRFHDIRRKAATDAEKMKGREYARQLLGHQHQGTTAIYISGAQRVKPLK